MSSMKWKVGDEFVVTDEHTTSLNSVVKRGAAYKVFSLERPNHLEPFHNVSANPKQDAIWFKGNNENIYYALLSCIRPLTKLEKILK